MQNFFSLGVWFPTLQLPTAGSPLPRALFANDVGYLPDGTAMSRAGNALNHPDAWNQEFSCLAGETG